VDTCLEQRVPSSVAAAERDAPCFVNSSLVRWVESRLVGRAVVVAGPAETVVVVVVVGWRVVVEGFVAQTFETAAVRWWRDIGWEDSHLVGRRLVEFVEKRLRLHREVELEDTHPTASVMAQ